MARIRTIKPEFFTSADIVELTPLSRLLYIALWCEADRDGKLSWNTKTLKMRYLPADDCSIDELAQELVDAGMVKVYTIDRKSYAEIPSFKSHQVINNREKESIIPSFVDVPLTRESAVKAEGRKEGKEGKGKEGAVTATKRGCQIDKCIIPDEDFISYSEDKYPHVDAIKEFQKFQDHWRSKGETRKDWLAGWRTWLANDYNPSLKAKAKGRVSNVR